MCAGFSTTSEQNAPLDVLYHSVDGRRLLLCTVPAQCHDEAAHDRRVTKGLPSLFTHLERYDGRAEARLCVPEYGAKLTGTAHKRGATAKMLAVAHTAPSFLSFALALPALRVMARQGQPRAACTRALLGSRSGAARSAPARPCADLGYRRRPGWSRV